jgi:hypothetical protein
MKTLIIAGVRRVGEVGNIKITANAPRQIPPANKTNQLLPKKTSNIVKIRAIDPHKSPNEIILNVSNEQVATNSPIKTLIFVTTLLSHIKKILLEAPLEAI